MSFTCWRDGGYFLGFLNDYPDYRTQGLSGDELISNLKGLLHDIESENIPYVGRLRPDLPTGRVASA